MRVRILVVPDSRAHPRFRNLLKWPLTIQQSLQKPEYNLPTRRRYFSPWIFAYLNSKEHGFFFLVFTLAEVRFESEVFHGQLWFHPHLYSVRKALQNYRRKAPQPRFMALFFYFYYDFFTSFFVFFGSYIRSLIHILNMQPVEETDRKTRAQMAQDKSRPGN